MKKQLFIVLAVTVPIGGCESLSSHYEAIGCGVGAAAGGLFANYMTRDKSQQTRVLATTSGVVLGGAAGCLAGRQLDEWTQRQLEVQTRQVLQSSTPNSPPSVVTNPSTGTQVKVEVVEQKTATSTVVVPTLKDRVDVVPPFEVINESYRVASDALNVRTGPGLDYRTSPPALKRGTEVLVIGKVIDKPDWMVVGQNGAISGYAYSGLLSRVGNAPAEVATAAKAPGANTETTTVAVTAPCKKVKQSVTFSDGKTGDQEATLCQQPDGTWLIT
ncbi:hypothetical protein D9M68_652920 [compost metagenome]